jgi:hypothetical protein
MASPNRPARARQSDTLADILERVLETGIVVAGDIRVNLNDVELLTIKIRLIVCSVDKAQEMGMDWWKNADYLNAGHGTRLSEGGADEDGAGDAAEAQARGERASGASERDEALARQLETLNERLARMEKRIDRLDDEERRGDEEGAGDGEQADDG